MFYQLPPAGNPVSLSKEPGKALPVIFSQNTYLYATGTAALAAALCAAIKLKNKKKRKSYCLLMPARIY
jgi:hypothetical protein